MPTTIIGGIFPAPINRVIVSSTCHSAFCSNVVHLSKRFCPSSKYNTGYFTAAFAASSYPGGNHTRSVAVSPKVLLGKEETCSSPVTVDLQSAAKPRDQASPKASREMRIM